MKTLKYLFGAASAMMLVTAASSASAAVSGTKHDLTSYTTDAGTEQICVYCHTPHGGGTDAPLWNRTGSTAVTWTMYSSGTMDAAQPGAPSGVSAACLSCHDGVTALDTGVDNQTQMSPFLATATIPTTSNAYLGADLSNDHPISIAYGQGDTADWRTVAQVTAVGATGDLALYGAPGSETVECGSCHDPHDNTVGLFLRKTNESSGICTTCHVK